jgi:uncharacterized membrane protein
LARTVVAIFESYDNAERAAHEIREKGLRTDNISIIVKDSISNSYNHRNANLSLNNSSSFTIQRGKRERISDGIITGGIFGGIAGIIIGGGSMLIPQLEIVSATGPLTGLISGLIAGGVLGGLIDIGVPKNKTYEYERLVSYGNAFFSMMVDEDRMDQIIQVLSTNNALMIEKY